MKKSSGKIRVQYLKTSIGELILGSFEDQLCLCDWRYRKMRAAIDKRIQEGLSASYEEADSTINQFAITQILEYLNGTRTKFELPLLFVGSDFQNMVWNELLKIPFGETVSYLGLSKRLGNEKAIRAVATANGANAISIIVPCHRVIGSQGELRGYAGGLPAKQKLLLLEQKDSAQKQGRLF